MVEKKFIASMTYYPNPSMAVDIMKNMVFSVQTNQQKMALNFSHVIANLSLITFNICLKKRLEKMLKSWFMEMEHLKTQSVRFGNLLIQSYHQLTQLGLDGTPNEVKLKYLADNNFADLRGDELKQAISQFINNKDDDLVGSMEAQGTTPRKLTDLIGSLSDLTSGSGDKGTPIVFIQGYFDNFHNNR